MLVKKIRLVTLFAGAVIGIPLLLKDATMVWGILVLGIVALISVEW